MIPSTEERRFRHNDLKRAALIDLLNNPVLGEAFSILTQAPMKEPPPIVGVHIDTVVAHEFYKMMGANGVLKGMVRMTHELNKSPEEVEDRGEEVPWGWAEETVQPIQPPAPIKTEKPSKKTRK